jgi:Flp pilus assembly protein TadG
MLKRSFRMVHDESGLAGVEFALILPVMIILFFGVYETSQALSARADVVNLTSAAADLVAQENAVTNADITNVYAAASTILDPYPRAGALGPSIRITSIIDDGKGVKDPTTGVTPPHASGKVDWVCTQTASAIGSLGTASAKNDKVDPLPSAIMVVGGSVIRVEVAYEYNSPTTQSITGPIVMRSTFYTRPRRALQITGPTANCNVTPT